jgi:L,D-peptidoglycan transpeptidase YkuD (ErfK/YbiS/YcfS/YnhG family)
MPPCVGGMSPCVRCLLWSLLLPLCGEVRAAVPESCRQLIVAVAPGWNSNSGKLQRFERAGREWRGVGEPVAVLFGRSGLAWGRGVLGAEEPGLKKIEKDGRAPAGVFRLGKIYTDDDALPRGAEYPFHTVGTGDAWIDDPAHPLYNRHVVVDPARAPPWFEKQRMRLGDFAYRWRLEIRHNSDPPVAGAGSAIFFHIRRGPTRPSAGCTTMAEADLVTLIRWVRAKEDPHYALLPREAYLAKWRAWGLPGPETAPALAAAISD